MKLSQILLLVTLGTYILAIDSTKYAITMISDSDMNSELNNLPAGARLSFNGRVAVLTGVCNVCTFTFRNGLTSVGCTKRSCSAGRNRLETFVVGIVSKADNLRQMLTLPSNTYAVQRGIGWIELTPTN